MKRCRLSGATVLTPDGWRDADILVDGNRISEIAERSARAEEADVVALEGGRLVPGFIDLQVNGGGGVLFNDEPTKRGIERIAEAHRPFGTCGLLPTLISDGPAAVKAAVKAVDEAIEAGAPGVLGVHLEGPFLNTGKKGIHDDQHFRMLTDDELDVMTSLKRGRTLVTLAPETVKPGSIRRLCEKGVKVALGHSLANYEEAKAGEAEGVTGYTHLFNAMAQIGSREPGPIVAALEGEAWCGLIADGHHVHPATLRLAIRAKRDRRFCLVTDAMPCVGTGKDSFQLGSRRITVKDGACRGEDGTLAGSALTMVEAVGFACDHLGLTLSEAVRFASREPAAFLGLGDDYGSLASGAAASLVHLSEDGRQVLGTMIDGQFRRHLPAGSGERGSS
jgi:N-acetylglucosamine-6-phosphate deacetylase